MHGDQRHRLPGDAASGLPEPPADQHAVRCHFLDSDVRKICNGVGLNIICRIMNLVKQLLLAGCFRNRASRACNLRYDRIAVLVDGGLAELGTHDELERNAGDFYALYLAQDIPAVAQQ